MGLPGPIEPKQKEQPKPKWQNDVQEYKGLEEYASHESHHRDASDSDDNRKEHSVHGLPVMIQYTDDWQDDISCVSWQAIATSDEAVMFERVRKPVGKATIDRLDNG
jgi:hypothetical protein